ncbi:MAG: hypothetical protein EOQ44_21860 [Mesorhizobium sp.]|uniref:hypothetical protein n=1 Tax=Mesorhizobium sp. TaxID=1871066 RepID=UPI000FEA1543|nr:hypothetical protein [Mesorhizobium sp.]RWB41896.1 MAG: hypothetical protein EOQ44_21860 [Mesorhizobium sp.]
MATLGTDQSTESDNDKLQIPPESREHIWDALETPPKRAKKAKSPKKRARDVDAGAEAGPAKPPKAAARNESKQSKSDLVL